MSPSGISVVVCTCNRPDTLEMTLASLDAQDHPSFEVIVVDQSSDERSREVVENLARMDGRFEYLRLETRGLSRAYNAGIARARWPLVAFTDDDCVAPADWLASVERTFAARPEIQLVYGQVLEPADLDGIDYSAIPVFAIPERRVLDRRHGFVVAGMGANFAARRNLFDEVGGFDEVLGGGGPLQSSQDFDFMYRVFRGGYSTLLEPDIKVAHYGYRDVSGWTATLRSYGVGVGGFFTKHARLGDLFATRLLVEALCGAGARTLKHFVMLRETRTNQLVYMRALLEGVRGSFRFPIDAHGRVYRLG